MAFAKPQALGAQLKNVVSALASTTIGQGTCVKRSTTENTVAPCTVAGEKVYGIALNDAAAGEIVSILRAGRYDRAVAGAAVAAISTALMTDTAGKLITATTGLSICAYNLTTVSGDGVAFTVELVQDSALVA